MVSFMAAGLPPNPPTIIPRVPVPPEEFELSGHQDLIINNHISPMSSCVILKVTTISIETNHSLTSLMVSVPLNLMVEQNSLG